LLAGQRFFNEKIQQKANQRSSLIGFLLLKMARPARFERATAWLLAFKVNYICFFINKLRGVRCVILHNNALQCIADSGKSSAQHLCFPRTKSTPSQPLNYDFRVPKTDRKIYQISALY